MVFYHAGEVPMLDINIAFAAGSAYDGQLHGLSALTTHLLDQGNADLTASQIAEKIAAVGAQYEEETSRDMVLLHLKTLTQQPALTEAVDALTLIISKPLFKYEAFKREKNQQLIAITHSQESPAEVADQAFFNKLYQNHPYAHPVIGTLASVNKITPGKVIEFYQKYFVSSNAVIVLVGAIDSNQAHQIAEQLTHTLPKGQKAPLIDQAPALVQSELLTIDFPASQTMLRLGQIGIDHTDADYFPLQVGNYILGGGMLVSRLVNEVREKRGLTYGIVSQFMPMPANGPFLISLSTQNSQADTALAVTTETLTNFINHGPTAAELTAAKQYMIGSFPLSLASNANIAGILLRMTFYHLPDNYLDTYTARIESVTINQIKQAFKQHLQPDKLLLVRVGKN